MKIFKYGSKECEKYLINMENRFSFDTQEESVVKAIIKAVKDNGDLAIASFTKKFDSLDLDSEDFLLSEKEWQDGIKKCDQKIKEIIDTACKRLEDFYRHTTYNSWFFYDEHQSLLGNRVLPLNKVLVYAPGGKATYPSSVLMGAIPAKIAGVSDVILTTPMRKEGIAPSVLYAAKKAGINRVYKIGGAQAIAGFSFGTATLPKVDKIVGPGNIYVATAKKLLYGIVDIDMVAGPSEVLVIFDSNADIEYVVCDMLSQLEHDEQSLAIAITDDEKMAKRLSAVIKQKAKNAIRSAIIEKSLKKSAVLLVKDITEAADVANKVAPEHLEIMTSDPLQLLPLIKNAGAVFLGSKTPEAVGDYIAGPNHVLPTGGTARFFSPLGVESFLKRMSVISFTQDGIEKLGKFVADFADEEGLFAHAESVKIRLKK